MALSWSDAIAKGIVTPAQRREALVKPSPGHLASQHEVSPPQAKLTAFVQHEWPGESVSNHMPLHPDRKFELDIAFPALKFGIEIDGYRSHGLSLAGFKRDRIKDRLLFLAGWRIMRFFATEIDRDLAEVTRMITLGRELCMKKEQT